MLLKTGVGTGSDDDGVSEGGQRVLVRFRTLRADPVQVFASVFQARFRKIRVMDFRRRGPWQCEWKE